MACPKYVLAFDDCNANLIKVHHEGETEILALLNKNTFEMEGCCPTGDCPDGSAINMRDPLNRVFVSTPNYITISDYTLIKTIDGNNVEGQTKTQICTAIKALRA